MICRNVSTQFSEGVPVPHVRCRLVEPLRSTLCTFTVYTTSKNFSFHKVHCTNVFLHVYRPYIIICTSWEYNVTIHLHGQSILEYHREIRLIEGNAKCCHLKKLTCKGTLRQLFISRLEDTVSHVGIFDPALWTGAPFNLLSSSTLPPPPIPMSKNRIYRQCGARRGWGCWVLLETIFCRSLTLCIWPD